MPRHMQSFATWVQGQLGRARAAAPMVAQSMVEYAIIAALVAVVAVFAVRTLGSSVKDIFGNVNTCMSDVAATAKDPTASSTKC